MTKGIDLTFELLQSTLNEAAIPALIDALDSPHACLREKAFSTLLDRPSVLGDQEILQRFHHLGNEHQNRVRSTRPLAQKTLRKALLGGNSQVCANGCQLAIWQQEYDLIPAMLNALVSPRCKNQKTLCSTILELTDSLNQALNCPPKNSKLHRRDPEQVRSHLTGALGEALEQYRVHQRKEVVEAFLCLTTANENRLRKILDGPLHSLYPVVMKCLTTSTRHGIIRFILNNLISEEPFLPLLSVVGRRNDLGFIRELLHTLDKKPKSHVRRNLKRIETITWLREPVEILEALDGPEQQNLVLFLMNTKVSRKQIYPVIEHLLLHGKTEGRRAAATALAHFGGESANRVALQGLDDSDEVVVATLIDQMRLRSIPSVLNRLLRMTKDPHPLVQEALRKSLHEFTFYRFASAFDILEEETRRSFGEMVKRVDSQAASLLRQELQSPSHLRCLRALRMVEVLGFFEETETETLALLKHEDHLIRVMAIELLKNLSTRKTHAGLIAAQSDESPLVRDAVERALKQRKPGTHSPAPLSVTTGAALG